MSEAILRGLSRAEAAQALAQHGPNLLQARRRGRALRRLVRVLAEPTLLALLAAFGLYLSMGSTGEALLLGGFVTLVVAITFVEETRTEEAVAALGQLASPRAVALREGNWTRIPGAEVVPGDLLRLAEGDRVPADVLLVEAHDLRIDESLLTGESAACWKRPGEGPESLAWAGCLVLGGQGLGRVQATGLETRMGMLSRSLASIQPDPTPFQAAAEKLVRVLGWVAAVACTAVVLVNLGRGLLGQEAALPWLQRLRSLDWAGSLLQGLTLAIATVPEELPVVLTVFMALGARRLSRHRVLVQRLPAIETLGAISVLAVDKTGTLTANRMRLDHALPVPGRAEAELLAAAARACEPEPFDPMEREILARAGAPSGNLVKEYELQGLPPRMGHLWDGGVLSMKGGLEGVLEHCRQDGSGSSWARSEALRLSSQGYRVLAVAEGLVEGLPEALPGGLRLLGLLAFHDPLRPGVPEALEACRKAGIRVVMLTGDSPETARAIAAQAGFTRPERVALGSELDGDPDKAAALARGVDVFARLGPHHKQTLVKLWSAQGQVVGMTGDGVNDAAALGQAHVGVAMGERGTEVAREAADVVLVDDSFTSLVEGVRLGRQTTRRILDAAVFVLAVHVPIVGLVLWCLRAGLPPLVSAAQVAFLELFIGPACSLVFERARHGGDSMRQPPRDPAQPFLPPARVRKALLQGLLILLAVGSLYALALDAALPHEEARGLAFSALMLADLMLCWTLLSPEPFWRRERWDNRWFWGVSVGVMGLLELLRRLPWTERVLAMPPLPASAWMLALGVAALASLWHEIPKIGAARPREEKAAGK